MESNTVYMYAFESDDLPVYTIELGYGNIM